MGKCSISRLRKEQAIKHVCLRRRNNDMTGVHVHPSRLKGAFFGYRGGGRRDADEDGAPAGITGNAALFPELVEDDRAPSLPDDRYVGQSIFGAIARGCLFM